MSLQDIWQLYEQTELTVYTDQSAKNTELNEEMEVEKLRTGRFLLQKW